MRSVKLPKDWLDKAIVDVMEETKDWPQSVLNLQAIAGPYPRPKDEDRPNTQGLG